MLIFDEVITGFGRLGTWTAAEYFGVTPDILNFAKQVTNGAIPLGGWWQAMKFTLPLCSKTYQSMPLNLLTAIPIRHIQLLAAALAALEVLERNLLAQSAALAQVLKKCCMI